MAKKTIKKGQNGKSKIFQGFLAITSAFFNFFAKRIFARSLVIPGASFDV